MAQKEHAFCNVLLGNLPIIALVDVLQIALLILTILLIGKVVLVFQSVRKLRPLCILLIKTQEHVKLNAILTGIEILL